MANDKIQPFKQNLKFWKTCIHHNELDNSPILKGFTDLMGIDVNNSYIK